MCGCGDGALCATHAEELRQRNTRQAVDIEQLKANERYLPDRRGALEHKLAAALALNTPLVARVAALEKQLSEAVRLVELVHPFVAEGDERMTVDGVPQPELLDRIRLLVMATAGASLHVSAPRSDNAPFRKPELRAKAVLISLMAMESDEQRLSFLTALLSEEKP